MYKYNGRDRWYGSGSGSGSGPSYHQDREMEKQQKYLSNPNTLRGYLTCSATRMAVASENFLTVFRRTMIEFL